jgi:hypothetical protein
MVHFQTKNLPKFGKNLEGLSMKNVDIFYGHLVYFMAIWNIFFPLWYIVPQEKSGNPVRQDRGWLFF